MDRPIDGLSRCRKILPTNFAMKRKQNSNGDTLTPDAHVSRAPALQPSPQDSTVDMRVLLDALVAVRNGNFNVRLPSEWTGLHGRIADAFNDIVRANQTMAQDLD